MEWRRKTKKHHQQQPRLERLNAKKNIDYEFHTIPSPPPTPPFLSDQETSLRVTGIDGEFDRIFQSLGLSGPEDFSIPTQDWEARKARFAVEDRVFQGGGGGTLDEVGPTNNTLTCFVDADVGVGVGVSPLSSGEHDVRGIVGRVRQQGERSVVFTDSGSFTTSHDDDSDVGGDRGCSGSGVVDDLVRFGLFRPVFPSWQKGDLLGKGSFGTVYEGFTE